MRSFANKCLLNARLSSKSFENLIEGKQDKMLMFKNRFYWTQNIVAKFRETIKIWH